MKACRPLYDENLYAKLPKSPLGAAIPRPSDVLVLGPVADEPDLRVLSLRRGFDAIGERRGKSMGASLFIEAPLDVPLRIDGLAAYRLLKAGLDHMDSFRQETCRLDVSASTMARTFAPQQDLLRALEGMEVSSKPMRSGSPITIVDASQNSGVTTMPDLMGLFIEAEFHTARGKSLLFSDSLAFVQEVSGKKEVYNPRAYPPVADRVKGPVAVQTEESSTTSVRAETVGAVPSDDAKSVHQFGPAAEALLKAVEQVAAADPKFRDAAIARLTKLAPKGEKAVP
ncbi:MAG: hypothetical protein PHW63_00730 [Alphaproteobacteria bacterium]|nr:hypothetical protein [Alphaproteobacteria bacterium]